MQNKRTPSLTLALMPLLAMLVLMVGGYGYLGLRVEVILLIAAAVSAVLALYLGYSWDDILAMIIEKFTTVMPALMVLIIVGGLIGTWMIGGSIPLLVFYGLNLIDPQYILLAAFLVTSITSIFTGTSWGSAGTVGVAMMGIATAMDASLPATAGAVVSGAYFGDKLSPLSDTTNFAPAVCGTTLYEHIQHMLYTTVPGFILAAFVFWFNGSGNDNALSVVPEKIHEITRTLALLYDLNFILLAPPLIVLWGAIAKKPTIPIMLASCCVAMFNAFVFQGFSINNIFDAMINGFSLTMLPDNLQQASRLVGDIPVLLERGGMSSMMSIILLVLCAFAFAGSLSTSGSLIVIITAISKSIKSTFSLISATIVTTLIILMSTSDGKLALLVPGEMFQDMYRKFGLDTKNLSRTVEDSGTVVEALIPWTAAGVFMAGTLGVATLDYLPWAILCYTGTMFALFYAYTGIAIAKLETVEVPEQTEMKKNAV